MTEAPVVELIRALEDRFEHIGKPGPQSQTTQAHARRNLSTLLILRKGPPHPGRTIERRMAS